MDDERRSAEFVEIERLIRLEKDEALKAFPKERFRSGLNIRMRSGPAPKSAGPFFVRRLVPAVLALGLVVAGALVLRPRLLFPTRPQTVNPFEAFFRTVPSLERTEAPVPFASSPHAEGLEETILRIWDSRGQTGPVPTVGREVPRLTPEQRMDILFRERAIHRFFARHFNITRIKEVSSWSKRPWFLSA